MPNGNIWDDGSYHKNQVTLTFPTNSFIVLWRSMLTIQLLEEKENKTSNLHLPLGIQEFPRNGQTTNCLSSPTIMRRTGLHCGGLKHRASRLLSDSDL